MRPLARTAAASAAAVLLLASCTMRSPHRSGRKSAAPTARPPRVVQHDSWPPSATSPVATSPGTASAGVTASWVQAENAKPGTTAWRIPASLPGPAIAGYASVTEAVAGQAVPLYVSTAAPTFHVEAYRMGYYGGTQGRLVWESRTVPGGAQPACPVTPGVNMVYCPWRRSLSVTVGPDWPQGTYLLKLVATGGQQSYVPLTVDDPASHATYLVQNSDFTWQAWNTYGGYDLYEGAAPGRAPTYAGRARVVSFDRPYSLAQGASDFLGNELPLVTFVEQQGLDVTYATDVGLEEDPALMLNHRAFLSLGHDECWALAQRQGAVNAIRHGVNFVFFAASPILRHVRLQRSRLGPDREMVDYRDPAADPIYKFNKQDATGNTWAAPPADDPPSLITGDTYGGYGINDPLVIADASAWVFAGTGAHDGTALPHVIRSDFDHYVARQPGPTDVQVLAHSPVVTPYGARSYADMTYYTNPASGAGVIATGTNAWIASLTPCPVATSDCPATIVRRVTANILRVFGAGPASDSHPSIPDAARYASG